MMARELKCEECMWHGVAGWLLPVARSAVPAGTYTGEAAANLRGRGRRRVFWPEHKVGKGDKAVMVPA
jgi:hypothetical protein